MRYKMSIEVLLEADDDAEAMDCIAEAMRPLLKEFEPKSSIIDWRYNTTGSEPSLMPHDGEGFEYK